MEEDAAGRGDVEVLEQLGVDQGQKHHLLQLLHIVLQPPHLPERHARIHLRTVNRHNSVFDTGESRCWRIRAVDIYT